MSFETNRRDLLKSALVGGFTVWVGGRAWSQENKSPNNRVNIACVGVGGKGDSDTADANTYGNVVAICDVDSNTLSGAAAKYPKAKQYTDYRKMLDEMHGQIDAVTVSIPDHSHAPAAAMAMHMHKAVYCQKPLAHSIYEVRHLSELARKMKVATQMGNQGTADNSMRKNAYTVRAGALGDVTEVHVWTNRPIWPQGISRPPAATPPSNLNWDLWLGPARVRPYALLVNDKGEVQNKSPYHDFNWRGWWDFGTGALGDMACHDVNLPFMALDLRDPISVQAETSMHNKDSYPKSSKIVFEFPANKIRKAVTLTWYDGGNRPSRDYFQEPGFADLINDGKIPDSGSLIIGTKGKLYSPGDGGAGGHIVGGVNVGDVTFPQSPGHWEEFLHAIRSSDPLDPQNRAMSNFPDYAGPLAETILLGNLAVWPADMGKGPKVEWDAKRLHAKGASDLASIVKPTYRAGYSL
jgi:predicted dehydrogenase